MSKLKIFLLTTCFIFTFAISSFADSESFESDVSSRSSYKYYVSYADGYGLYFNEFVSIRHDSNNIYITGEGGCANVLANGTVTDNTLTIGFPIKNLSIIYTNNSSVSEYVVTYGLADSMGSLGGDVTIPPWMEVEELPTMVGSIILLIASVGISILCLMQLPTLVKKLLLFLH